MISILSLGLTVRISHRTSALFLFFPHWFSVLVQRAGIPRFLFFQSSPPVGRQRVHDADVGGTPDTWVHDAVVGGTRDTWMFGVEGVGVGNSFVPFDGLFEFCLLHRV